MLKRMRLVRKKLKEVPFSLRAQRARSAPECFPARPLSLRFLTAPSWLAAVQIARLEEIRASGERELNEDELTKLGSGAAFREEVRTRACVRMRVCGRVRNHHFDSFLRSPMRNADPWASPPVCSCCIDWCARAFTVPAADRIPHPPRPFPTPLSLSPYHTHLHTNTPTPTHTNTCTSRHCSERNSRREPRQSSCVSPGSRSWESANRTRARMRTKIPPSHHGAQENSVS